MLIELTDVLTYERSLGIDIAINVVALIVKV